MLIINEAEQKKVMKMSEVIEACAKAVSEYSAGRTETPVRSTLPVEKFNGRVLTMPSIAAEAGSMGLKFVTSYPGNTKKGKSNIQALVFLADVETGEPLALLEGSYLTVMKTGALTGLATQLLARHNADSLAVIGTGAQALGLVEAVLAVRPIKQIFLVNRSRQKAEAFAEQLTEQHADIAVSVLQEADLAVEKAAIIVTSTSSDTPVFSADKVKPGTHINAVGSFHPSMQEIPSQVLVKAAKVVVESKKAALEETGDLQVPIREGVFSADKIHAELGEIINGGKQGRTSEQEITLFKSVGLATADIVVGDLFYRKVLEKGAGQHINL